MDINILVHDNKLYTDGGSPHDIDNKMLAYKYKDMEYHFVFVKELNNNDNILEIETVETDILKKVFYFFSTVLAMQLKETNLVLGLLNDILTEREDYVRD